MPRSRTACPPAHLLPERTTAVLGVLYLLFNEGYAATTGPDLMRQGLCTEAIRLARVLDPSCRTSPRRAACWRSCSCITRDVRLGSTPRVIW